jgi:hypothetical protein
MKQKLKLSILLLFFMPLQKIAGQDIIMGSQPMVADIEDSPRYFYDPGGNGDFAQGLRDTMMLRTAVMNTQLYVLFEEFAMGVDDTLWIYDGASVNAPLMGFYSLVNSPGEIVSTGRDMTFVFHSGNEDILGLQGGWKALVYANDPQPMEVNYGELPSVLTCNAFFYDAGGPNGNIGTAVPNNSFTEFTSPVGSHVKCEFTQFSMDGLLKIYDGQYNDPNKRLIGQFCTSTLDASTNNMPPILFSTTNTLCFVYEGAPGDASKPGWRAEISCVPELLEYEGYSILPEISNTPLGYYADAANPHVIELDTLHPMVMLKASPVNIPGPFSCDYTVQQIPYNEDDMMFGYDEGNAIEWQQGPARDDSWLGGVDLPFTFTFFGVPYTRVYPSSNGLVSFDTPPEGEWYFCAWKTSVPPSSPTLNGGTYSYTSTPYNYYNSAYLVYEDINPNENCTPGGQYKIKYGVLGEPPCRAFVFNYDGINLYSCCSTTGPNTYQMVMYEGTNVIDVYVKRRNVCTSWNGGRGVIGLQNRKGSQRVIAPGRDFNSTWTVNVDNLPNEGEAWRFTPITPPDENGELTWYKDVVDDAHIISQGLLAQNRTVAVVPTETTSYISEYKFTNAARDLITLRDTTLVLFPEPEPIDSTGVAEVRGTDFTVYPNPTRDAVYVKMKEGRELPARLEVLDLHGRPLFTVPAQETTRVDLSRLPSGVYLLKVGDGRKGSAVKITKQ